MRFFIFIITLFFIKTTNTQVLITTSNYSQNFGTSAITSWTNNSTFLGWYVNDVTEFLGEVNVTATAPTNTGGTYVYRCSSGSDRKFGGRASGGTATMYYGVRIKNTTGSTINSITVSYTAFQLSLAENNNNVNTNTFSYKVVASPSVIDNLTTTTGYTNVASLNYAAPTNHGGPGTSNQVNGIPCTTSSNISACVPVVIQNNGEIMLRWTDIDNSANDHHIAIDDVQVLFHFDNVCAVTLPIELLEFNSNRYGSDVMLSWSTLSQTDNDYFELERLSGSKWYPISKFDSDNGHGIKYYNYLDTDTPNELVYYRLKQTDYNGNYTYSHIISFDNRVVAEEISKVTNLLGQPITIDSKGIKILHLNNGTTIKTFN